MFQNGTFFNLFPTPQPPGTLGPSPRARARSCDSGGGLTALYDQMAPQLCPFEISNFDTFSTTPPKHVWALWDSPGGGNEIFFSHNIYVLGLLFFVPANATAEQYENEFPQGPLPPERIVIIVIPLNHQQLETKNGHE